MILNLLDQFRFPINSDIDFWLYQISRASLLQSVGHNIPIMEQNSLNGHASIFHGDRFSSVANVLVAIVVAWTVAFFLSNLLQCIPIQENWTGLGDTFETCIDTNQMYIAQAYSDIITDGTMQKNAYSVNP